MMNVEPNDRETRDMALSYLFQKDHEVIADCIEKSLDVENSDCFDEEFFDRKEEYEERQEEAARKYNE